MAATPLRSIPVHLFTGFLGSGKSTLIRRLIEQKPANERWAVLINEFGQVGIDQTMFESRDDVIVKGLPGGCMCCQLAFVLQATLVNLLHRHRPDRLLIEPSGLGHPAGLLDTLRSDAFAEVLVVQDIVALLDPARLEDPRVREHDTFNDQLAMADAVALTMTDRAGPQAVAAAEAFVEQLWPPKKWVAHAAHGELDVNVLMESGRHTPAAGGVSNRHAALRDPGARMLVLDEFVTQAPQPGRPVAARGQALGYHTQGWRWSPTEVFDLDRLTLVLDRLPSGLRVKGVLHTDAGWRLYNRGEGAASLTVSAWRQDSRLELIGEAAVMPPADDLLAAIHACRVRGEKVDALP
ncbi:GTP-binding protein [Halomonas sp. KM-1]|uniref:CobW family GTP-binding protein n=1 Tax=Halomonas sp. KM-1 TaxID=590061 RepID=UPI00028879FC|nr:GTP-binding protein [Halomonas sp. KM-1]